MQGFKYCRTCRETKPLDAFGKLTRAPDGLNPCCKACRNAHERDRHATNPQARQSRRDAVKRSRAKYDQLHQDRLNRRTT